MEGASDLETVLAEQALQDADGGALSGSAADAHQQALLARLVHQPQHTLPRRHLTARCSHTVLL